MASKPGAKREQRRRTTTFHREGHRGHRILLICFCALRALRGEIVSVLQCHLEVITFSTMPPMSRPVPVGAHAEVEEVVEFKHTLTAHHSKLPPVYSTPDMIRLMEVACFHALQPYAEDGEINVGTAIHVEHRAATGIGSRVRARAEMESFDGRFYVMRVRAWAVPDSPQNSNVASKEIGRGTIHRAVIRVADFLARLPNS